MGFLFTAILILIGAFSIKKEKHLLVGALCLSAGVLLLAMQLSGLIGRSNDRKLGKLPEQRYEACITEMTARQGELTNDQKQWCKQITEAK